MTSSIEGPSFQDLFQQVIEKQSDTIDQSFRKAFVEKMTQLVKNHYEIMQRYRDKQLTSEDLRQGIWYAPKYYQALKEKGSKEKLDFLFQEGYFMSGYLSQKHFSRVEEKLFLRPSASGAKQWKGFAFVAHAEIESEAGMKKQSASDALDVITDGLAILDCGSTVCVAYYMALREVLGKPKFNRVYDPIKNPLTIASIGNCIDIPTVFSLITVKSTKAEESHGHRWAMGDIFYFENVSGVNSYLEKHPFGTADGYWVVCLGGGKVTGLGLPPEGYTRGEMGGHLLDAYNQLPDLGSWMDEENREKTLSIRKNFKKLQGAQLTKKEFAQSGGGTMTAVILPSIQTIFGYWFQPPWDGGILPDPI